MAYYPDYCGCNKWKRLQIGGMIIGVLFTIGGVATAGVSAIVVGVGLTAFGIWCGEKHDEVCNFTVCGCENPCKCGDEIRDPNYPWPFKQPPAGDPQNNPLAPQRISSITPRAHTQCLIH